MQRGKSGNERRYACAIYHSILSARIELKKSSKFKEKLNSEQVADLRSFFFFGTFFFLCGEIEFLGKMGITLSRQKTASDCSFESVVLCRFKKSTYIRKKYTRLLPHRLRHSKKTPLRGLFSMTKTDGSTTPARARAARDWANSLAQYDTYLLRHQSL